MQSQDGARSFLPNRLRSSGDRPTVVHRRGGNDGLGSVKWVIRGRDDPNSPLPKSDPQSHIAEAETTYGKDGKRSRRSRPLAETSRPNNRRLDAVVDRRSVAVYSHRRGGRATGRFRRQMPSPFTPSARRHLGVSPG